jgi:hypothetical protein
MAARASLKASSFYKVYHDSLDEKLAAIPS